MKKLLTLIATLSTLLHAEPYFGFGGTFTNKDEGCRAYVVALAGYQVNDKFAVEGRYSHTARGDDQYANLYAKLRIYKDAYGLIGFEQPINSIKKYHNANFGLGYQIGKVGFEVVYKHKQDVLTTNVVFRF